MITCRCVACNTKIDISTFNAFQGKCIICKSKEYKTSKPTKVKLRKAAA